MHTFALPTCKSDVRHSSGQMRSSGKFLVETPVCDSNTSKGIAMRSIQSIRVFSRILRKTRLETEKMMMNM